MNLTLLAALVLLAAWLVLLVGYHSASGSIHLFYAGAAVLVARRILVGAHGFRS
ncbi:MAG TPA: hypothetical protein VI159_09720 [Gemmatimonadales bacterium]